MFLFFLAEIAQNTTGCKCPVQCNRTVYEPVLSYAQLSKFNLDRIALSDAVSKKAVEMKFKSAMETSQRVVEAIVAKDQHLMNTILTLITAVQENVNSTKQAFRSGETFSRYFRVVDLFSADDRTWKKEKAQIEQMTYALTNNVYSFSTERSALYDFYTQLRNVLKMNNNNESKVVNDLQRCLENQSNHPIYGTTLNPYPDSPEPTGLYTGAIRSVDTSTPSTAKKSEITEDQESLDECETQVSSPITDDREEFGSKRYARSTVDDTTDVSSGVNGETGSSSRANAEDRCRTVSFVTPVVTNLCSPMSCPVNQIMSFPVTAIYLTTTTLVAAPTPKNPVPFSPGKSVCFPGMMTLAWTMTSSGLGDHFSGPDDDFVGLGDDHFGSGNDFLGPGDDPLGQLMTNSAPAMTI